MALKATEYIFDLEIEPIQWIDSRKNQDQKTDHNTFVCLRIGNACSKCDINVDW